jgi:hypothetical protein
VLPSGLVQALGPVLYQIATMTVKIKQYDSAIKGLTETEYSVNHFQLTRLFGCMSWLTNVSVTSPG